MSWTYKTISRDISGWCSTDSEDDSGLRNMDQNGWEFVSGFALKAQPDADDQLVMTFRQSATQLVNNFHPMEISGG